MKRKIVIRTLIVILCLLLAAVGTLLFLRPTVDDNQRQTVEEQILVQIEQGEVEIEIDITDIPEVEGEASEFVELEAELPVEVVPEEEEESGPVRITGYGVIAIPSINLKMPLARGADRYSLRAAAGWYPDSAAMGQAGNCVIFGHRMSGYGRHFNRLNEVKAGDKVTLYDTGGNAYTYVVSGSEEIRPEDLMDTLRNNNEGYRLTLVTCTPTGVGTRRLLVYADLEIYEEGSNRT